MKKQFVLLVVLPVLFLVFMGQMSFAQVKHEPGLYYPYNLVSDDRDVQIYGMPFGLSGSGPDVIKFFTDTLPCVKNLYEKYLDIEVYDSTYRFSAFAGDKRADTLFLKMCEPDRRIYEGDSITVLYLITKNQEKFNYDALVMYYNGVPVKGKLYYQVKPRRREGQYDILGNNTNIEDDAFIVTVKDMLAYEKNKRKIAKLVPVKPVISGTVAFTPKEKKNGKIVVNILDDKDPNPVVKKVTVKKDTIDLLVVSEPHNFSVVNSFKPMVVGNYPIPDLPKIVLDEPVVDPNLKNEIEQRLADSKKLNVETAKFIEKRSGEVDDTAQENEIANFDKEVKVNIPQKKNVVSKVSVVKITKADSVKFENAKKKAIAEEKKKHGELVAQIQRRNKEISDSVLNQNKKISEELAYYKKQDSVRKQTEKAKQDSITNAREQKRISDSTEKAIAIENEKARFDDSVKKATALAFYVLDTTQKGIIARHIADSIVNANHIKDSLVRADDSVKNATALLEWKLKKAEEERDSIARIITVKEKPELVYRNTKPKVLPEVNKIPHSVIREPEVVPMVANKIPPENQNLKIIKVVDSTTYDKYGRPVRHTHYVIQKK